MTPDYGLSRRTLRIRTAFQFMLGAAVVLMLALLVAVALQNRANGERLVSCTTPGHPCYDESTKRQADVIGTPAAPINNVTILAAACGAAHPGDVLATRACVERGLKR